jgi:hypothetical protein
VIALDAGDVASRRVRRHAERIALSLNHEHRNIHRVELGQARFLRATGRMDGEGKAQNRDGFCLPRRPARDARAERASPGDQREAG